VSRICPRERHARNRALTWPRRALFRTRLSPRQRPVFCKWPRQHGLDLVTRSTGPDSLQNPGENSAGAVDCRRAAVRRAGILQPHRSPVAWSCARLAKQTGTDHAANCRDTALFQGRALQELLRPSSTTDAARRPTIRGYRILWTFTCWPQCRRAAAYRHHTEQIERWCGASTARTTTRRVARCVSGIYTARASVWFTSPIDDVRGGSSVHQA